MTLTLTELLFSSLSGCFDRDLADLLEWCYGHVGTSFGLLNVVVTLFLMVDVP